MAHRKWQNINISNQQRIKAECGENGPRRRKWRGKLISSVLAAGNTGWQVSAAYQLAAM